jgi:choice-of-anchor C domain-containing protein
MTTIPRGATLLISLTAGIAIAGAMAATAPAPAGAKASTSLVLNRGFEKPVGCGVGPVYACTYYAGTKAIPHWAVGGDSIDLTSSSFWQSAAGKQSIDLAGAEPGSVTQKVATTAGTTYTLGWHLAGNPQGPPAIKIMNVYWDGTFVRSVRFDTTGHTERSMGWVWQHVTVTATGTTSSITFADGRTSGYSPFGPALDLVTLRPVG